MMPLVTESSLSASAPRIISSLALVWPLGSKQAAQQKRTPRFNANRGVRFSVCQDCLVQTHPADQERPTISHLIGLAIDASTILYVTRERAPVSNPFTICTIPVTTVATVTPASNLNSELRIVHHSTRSFRRGLRGSNKT